MYAIFSLMHFIWKFYLRNDSSNFFFSLFWILQIKPSFILLCFRILCYKTTFSVPFVVSKWFQIECKLFLRKLFDTVYISFAHLLNAFGEVFRFHEVSHIALKIENCRRKGTFSLYSQPVQRRRFFSAIRALNIPPPYANDHFSWNFLFL